MTYSGVHSKLRRTHGPASAHQCASGCGNAAQEWAYNHSGVDERTGLNSASKVTYSTDLTQYVALCRVCHRNRDKHKAQGWVA